MSEWKCKDGNEEKGYLSWRHECGYIMQFWKPSLTPPRTCPDCDGFRYVKYGRVASTNRSPYKLL